MGISGKKVVKESIKCNGDILYALFKYKLPDLVIIAPEYIKSCELEQGEWGTIGCIMNWTYVIDGQTQVAKEYVETLDEKNKLVTLKVLEGDLLSIYKSLKEHIQVTANDENSAMITWTLEYESMNENAPYLDSFAVCIQNIITYIETRMNPDSVANYVKIPQLQY